MLLFSTILKINETMTKDDFIQLAIEWNQKSPHPENIISDIVWNGERNIRYGNSDIWLDIEEYRNENIIAIRYEKTEEDGVVWDTDYIMNFNEMKLSIRLDRSFLESALTIRSDFSTPHFIKLLIDHNYLEPDNILDVTDKITIIDSENINVLTDVINQNSDYYLPVVYVSKTYHGTDPVDTTRLAKRLKGAAHVLVQKGAWLNTKIREACNDNNEYYGAIGIYYPNKGAGHRKYYYRALEGFDDKLLDRVVSSVILYSNSQMISPLYTWQGVNNALLRDRYSSQKEERRLAEFEKAKAEDEVEKLWDSFDDDIKKLQKQIEKLTKENDALLSESQGLRLKLNATNDVPLIIYGNEDDFFHGEIKEIVMDAIKDQLQNTPKKTRRYDVLSDIIEFNDEEGPLKNRKNEVKNLFKNYNSMSGTMKQSLQDLGFIVKEEGKHYRLTYFGDGRYYTTVAKTPSDHREGKNIATTIIKSMM